MSAPARLAFRVAGAGLLAASGGIHLDLYLAGYSSIPVIGWLFLLQAAVAFVLGLGLLVTGYRVLSAVAVVFVLATLGGYLLSVWTGLFGFKEFRTGAGIAAGVVEVAAVVVLATLAFTPAGLAAWWPARLPARGVVAGVSVLGAGALAAAGVLAPGGSRPSLAPAPAEVLKTRVIDGVKVLTDSRGFTLYWFALDTPSASRCAGSCTAFWPPLDAMPVAGPGVTGTLGTITRSSGATQATYDGHPLYTYAGDSTPGLARGNGLDLNGGLWHEVTVPG